MPPLNLLIKPASSNCNLKCKYCFYYSISEQRRVKSYGIMSEKLLETLVKKALSYSDYSCNFGFQGGEPTLAGIDFYRKLIELEKQHNIKGVRVFNSLQTNGIIIDDAWAKFLSENKFLVGLSLDGPADIHDINRVNGKNEGSYKKVMETVKLFNKYGVEYNILFVANNNVAKHITKIYTFFKKNNFRYLQFIPCLDPLNEQPGMHKYSLKPDTYLNFLKSLFDLWYEDIIKEDIISIRFFDNIVGTILGYRPEACDMSGICQGQLVFEADGGVYPCDFFVIDEWQIGNIMFSDMEEIVKSDKNKRFTEMSKHIDPRCKTCRYYKLCRGGCRRNREPFEDGKPGLNYFCSAYRKFYDYAGERMYKVAKLIARKSAVDRYSMS